MSISEKIQNYPPNSAYFIDTNNNRIDVVDSDTQSLRVSLAGSAAGASAFDAFGRQRVSNPYTLFDTKNRYYDHQDFSTYVSGGTVNYLPNESSHELIVGTSAGNKAIRESKKIFPYQPGKSLLIMSSFKFSPAKVGLRQRVGYFNSSNGIFLESNGVESSFVERSSISGVPVDTKVSQADWNLDKMDGTGPSGIVLDVSKTHIFWTDIEWLGVGSVRVGFVINGKIIPCHIFHHANLFSSVYMTTANLPIRLEIENISETNSQSSMKQICSTVISEGGYDVKSEMFFTTIGGNITSEMKTLPSAGTIYPLITIKLNSNRMDAIIALAQMDMIVDTSDNLRYYLIKNGSLTSSSFTQNGTGSVDVDTSATAITGGQILQQGFLSQRASMSLFGKENFNYQLTRALNSENTYSADTITLAVSSFSPSVKIASILGWYELT